MIVISWYILCCYIIYIMLYMFYNILVKLYISAFVYVIKSQDCENINIYIYIKL